jgi:toxin ParE1/3/4
MSSAGFVAAMAVEIIIAPEAEQDVAEAYAWYEDRRAGLGEEFLSCVDACIEAMGRTPEMHAVVYENYRRALVRRFPYAVFYEYAGGVWPLCTASSTRRVIQRNGLNACVDLVWACV